MLKEILPTDANDIRWKFRSTKKMKSGRTGKYVAEDEIQFFLFLVSSFTLNSPLPEALWPTLKPHNALPPCQDSPASGPIPPKVLHGNRGWAAPDSPHHPSIPPALESTTLP
jgi:hypothetical protein